jgi:hypothetical protein
LTVLASASLANAQAVGPDKASAEALFNEGVTLVAAGNFAEGCRKFEGSQALDATLGTSLRLADCYERLGKTASAWALFKQAQGMAHVQNQGEREQLAHERVEALEPKLSYLNLTIEGEAPAGLAVQRNGSAVPLASLGVAIPIDPGTQRITASAPSYEDWSKTLEIAAGPGRISLRIPALVQQKVRAATQASSREPASGSSTQRSLGITASGVGLVAVLVGGGLGLHAKSENDRSQEDSLCPNDNHNGCTPEGVSARQHAQSFATASTITLIAGGVVLASGIVLWSTAPSQAEHPAQARLQLSAGAAPGAFGTSLRGTW